MTELLLSGWIPRVASESKLLVATVSLTVKLIKQLESVYTWVKPDCSRLQDRAGRMRI